MFVYGLYVGEKYMSVVHRAVARQKVGGALDASINRRYCAGLGSVDNIIKREQAYDRRVRRMIGRLREGAKRAALRGEGRKSDTHLS